MVMDQFFVQYDDYKKVKFEVSMGFVFLFGRVVVEVVVDIFINQFEYGSVINFNWYQVYYYV